MQICRWHIQYTRRDGLWIEFREKIFHIFDLGISRLIVGSLEISSKSQEHPNSAASIMEDSRRNAFDQLLRNNFDAVSSTCIVTITKYVTNIANNPVEPKYECYPLKCTFAGVFLLIFAPPFSDCQHTSHTGIDQSMHRTRLLLRKYFLQRAQWS